MRLKAINLAKLPVGKHADGNGLMLVKSEKSSSWVLRIQVRGKSIERGLGSLDQVSLSQARTKAQELRQQLKSGEARPDQVKRGQVRKRQGDAPTFAEAVDQTFEAMKPGWKSGKHVDTWIGSLRNHAIPTLGKMPVDAIEPADVADCLRPIWQAKAGIAEKVFVRIGQVMTYGNAMGWCSSLNMAAVRLLLPRLKTRETHFASLPYAAMPEFMTRLRDGFSLGRIALEFTILTACRSGEIRGMKWDELSPDWKEAEEPVWTVPADRMKGGKEHRVPLTPAMINVLRKAELVRRGDFVFPGRDGRKAMSDMTMRKVLSDMKETFVPHGCRASFKAWAVECQHGIPGEVSETALAHVTGTAVERAYRREAEAFAVRRRLMNAWSEYLA